MRYCGGTVGTIARALAHTVVVLAFHFLATIVAAAAIIVPLLFWD
jgi:hypothetical protein